MRKFIESDEELASHYTTSLGIRAQSYEPISTRSFDPGEAHVAMRETHYRRRLEKYAAVGATVAAVPVQTRHPLDLIYAPFGTGFTPQRKDTDATNHEDDATPDFLAIALTPPWGHGSFVRLALTQKRVLTAFTRRHPGKPSDPATVLDFLSFEAGRGTDAAAFFRNVREACEEIRSVALEVYEGFRQQRLDSERARSKQRTAERILLLDAGLGRNTKKESARFEARLRGVS